MGIIEVSLLESRQFSYENNTKIPLNNFSFFQGLGTNLLPPSQIQIKLLSANDNNLIYRAHAVDPGRVIVTKLILWVPRLIFNADGCNCYGYSYY